MILQAFKIQCNGFHFKNNLEGFLLIIVLLFCCFFLHCSTGTFTLVITSPTAAILWSSCLHWNGKTFICKHFPGQMRPTGNYNGVPALKPSCSCLSFSFPFLLFNCRSVDTVKYTLWSVDPFSHRNMVITSSQQTKLLKVWVADFQLDRGKPSAVQIRRQIGCFSSISFNKSL